MKPDWVNRLEGIRHEKGLSQEDFGSALGFSKAQISKLENGKVPEATKRLLRELEEIFGVNPDWLTKGSLPKYVSKGTYEETPEETPARYPAGETPARPSRETHETNAMAFAMRGMPKEHLRKLLIQAIDDFDIPTARILLGYWGERGASSSTTSGETGASTDVSAPDLSSAKE